MKNPDVPCRCGVVSRNSGPLRVRELRPLLAERLRLEPDGVDDRLVLVGVQRADRVDDRAARPRALGGGAQELELELRAAAARASAGRAGGARTPRPEHGASTSARSKPLSSSSRTSALTTRTFVAPSRRTFSSSSRARPGCSSTAVTSPRSIVALPPGAAQASRTRSPSREPTASAASCEPRLCGQMRPSRERLEVDAIDAIGARDVGRLADRHGRADDELARLVLRAHQRERLVGAPVAHPRLVDPVGIRLLERAVRQRRRRAPGSPRRAGGATAFVNPVARSRPAARTSSTASSATACAGASLQPSS